MSAEAELAQALHAIRQENVRLQQENARLREVLATYPERLLTMAQVLSEVRGLTWQVLQAVQPGALPVGGRTPDLEMERPDTLTQTGIAPSPDERWWPQDLGPDLKVHTPEDTQVQIPEEPQWARDESDDEGRS